MNYKWQEDWAPGNWKHMMIPYDIPTFRIPEYLREQIIRRKNATVMPAGPLVAKYEIEVNYGSKPTEYGHPPGLIDVQVEWLPQAEEIHAKRKELLGPDSEEVNVYHSQIAVCPTWTLLNELNRKITRTRDHLDYVQDRAMRADPRWEEGWRKMHEVALECFEFDKEHIEHYVKEHKGSTVIPPTHAYRGVKWGQLEEEDLRDLFESAKSFLEYKIENWDIVRAMQWLPEAMGLGSRARSPKIEGFVTELVKVKVPRARDIGYNPYLSSWWAWMPKYKSHRIYDVMTNVGEDVLGCEIAFPPNLGGQYWQKIAEYIEQGCVLVNGDGTNWDSWVTALVNDYSFGAERGVPGLVSGGAFTTAAGTYANYIITPDHIDMSQVIAIFVLGDDKLVVLKPGSEPSAVREIPGVWEIDPVATKHTIVLGLVVLPERKGTFSGLYRISIDRGDARIPLKMGQPSGPITSNMNDENRLVYEEIMGEGTLQGIPLIDRISDLDVEEFWTGWRTDRYEYLSTLESSFSVLYDEDYVEVG